MSPGRCQVALVGLLVAVGCSNNNPPHLFDLEPKEAYVGSRLEIRVVAADPDGDALIFTFSSPTPSITARAALDAGSNQAVFSWTPEEEDVGEHLVDFTVTDGEGIDIESVVVTVRPRSGGVAPLFRKPVGEGTTLDLSIQQCLQLEVLVEDPDSPTVELRQNPAIEGANFQITGAYGGLFSWCPSQSQTYSSVYAIHLEADDHDNPLVTKDYVILLRTALPANCPGFPPVIAHTSPPPMISDQPIQLTAQITDEKGIKEWPVVYHATELPQDPSNLDYQKLSLASMFAAGPGIYRAELPNPTAKMASGESATLYYVIVAEDDDDRTGPCDHRTQAPPSGMFQVTVTRP